MKLRNLLIGSAAICVSSAAVAADMRAPAYQAPPPPPVSSVTWEVGGRYWFSTGKNAYDYLAGPNAGDIRISRLSYEDLHGHTGEAYFRLDSRIGAASSIFLKGYVGGGGIRNGKLFDEDFPPLFVPYSKTVSDVDGKLFYGSVDLGYNFYDTMMGYGPGARLGAFIGYHHWNEKVDARGCTQLAGNPFVCPPGLVPAGVVGITEEDKWNSLRLGIIGEWAFAPGWKISAEGAYVRASQKALDIHHFTFGAAPASGKGDGVQAEAILSYQVTQNFTLGGGARWWYLETNATDVFNQRLEYKTERYGGFLQASYKFGGAPVYANY